MPRIPSSRVVGIILLVGSPILMGLYFYGVFFTTLPILQVTALLAILFVLVITSWIGYTMVTEPKPPMVRSDELDTLEPETINPRPESKSIHSVIDGCEIGKGTVIRDHVNLYHCRIGEDSKVESFVYIEEGVKVGQRCKIKPNVFIPTGVTIEDDVFIGPNVTFTNDKHPKTIGPWTLSKTRVMSGASIGAGAVILPGVTIGKGAVVGAGAVVTKNVEDHQLVIGNPAHVLEPAAVDVRDS